MKLRVTDTPKENYTKIEDEINLLTSFMYVQIIIDFLILLHIISIYYF